MQRRLEIEQLVVVAHRARIAVDEQHADLVAQCRADVAPVVDRERVAGDLDRGVGGAPPGGSAARNRFVLRSRSASAS